MGDNEITVTKIPGSIAPYDFKWEGHISNPTKAIDLDPLARAIRIKETEKRWSEGEPSNAPSSLFNPNKKHWTENL